MSLMFKKGFFLHFLGSKYGIFLYFKGQLAALLRSNKSKNPDVKQSHEASS